ncbi:cdp-diacylglycerol-glycerol-3-phosphate 3-phosphatidyltransferase [Grosmannia clavigera kw1407]|uniref:CDP-diacylglycerol--glycerol-3-phosphate 3-phosphatidyltransferase n=1 Tax=Grosmannia clavigera (strain kw1407 / UAMH 11150) TaxID=655863 RepID=F0XCA1_GROCL|nr:cdp-diacylglycerol-glycerol-3-phosphate 3-phosphatidyltransferase [Grosmannia clavigera kw1407]EFX04549.1 cdp-diacylglycerol-glycerol-3-phosphate 3-phosphatidyltransferase [Grosmannia clavigera kw1407]
MSARGAARCTAGCLSAASSCRQIAGHKRVLPSQSASPTKTIQVRHSSTGAKTSSSRSLVWIRCLFSSGSVSVGRRLSSTTAVAAAAKSAKPVTMMASASGMASGSAVVTVATAGLMLAPFVDELDRIAPCFRIHGSQVRVLETPAEFYETLKTMIRGAEHRIFLSTLYIGKSETELINTLQTALRAKPALKLSIVTDALRGTRESPAPSCASLLAPLVAEFGADRVELRMYHTPNLTGLRRRCIPKRINEGWGLQHMKLYGVDDEIVLTGANLSMDYFTNRQDRYHVFSSRDVTDFYWQLHSAVSSLSFQVRPSPTAVDSFEMVWPDDNRAPSPLEQPGAFVTAATGVLHGLVAPQKAAAAASPGADTSVYVLAQMTQLLRPDSSTERPALTHVLQTLSRPDYAGSSWTFTAGYFNPAPSLTKLLLSTAAATGTVITASPYANGFYRSPGVSGMLPDAYTFLAHRFLKAADRTATSAITLKEWRRGTVGQLGGWTYHAKGLWITLPGEMSPAMTLVGSSNYTKRSYTLDLEANALVVTRNAALQARLGAEESWLQTYAQPVSRDDFAQPERRVRAHVRLAMWIVQALGGAL